jgi:hypothetical protein
MNTTFHNVMSVAIVALVLTTYIVELSVMV